MPKLFRLLVLLLPAFFLTISGCKKEEEKPGADQTQTITLNKSSVTPGEAVILEAAADLDGSDWQIKVGGETVRLTKIDARQAVFLVPVLPSGPLPLDLSALHAKSSPTLTMGNYMPIKDADQALTDFNTQLTNAINHLAELSRDSIAPVEAQDVASMRSLQQTFGTMRSSLSASDKLAAAYVLRNLPMDLVNFRTVPRRPAGGTATTATADPGADFEAIGLAFVSSAIKTTACVGTFALLVGTPDPTFVTKILAVGAATAGILQLTQSLKLLKQLGENYSLVHSFELNNAQGFSWTAGNTFTCDAVTVGRALMTSDASGSAFMQGVFSAQSKLQNVQNRFINGFNLVRAWFGNAQPVSAFVSPIKQALDRKYKSMSTRILKIRNISNSAINLAVSAVGEKLALVASSTTLTGPTSFNFDAVYENATLGITTKQNVTVRCDFTPVDSMSIYKTALLGSWTARSVVPYIRSGTTVLDSTIINYIITINPPRATDGPEVAATYYMTNDNGQPPTLGFVPCYIRKFPSGYKLSLPAGISFANISGGLIGRIEATADNATHQRLKLPLRSYTVRVPTTDGRTARFVMTKQ
ncbi:hypothetical protein GCM10028824_18210 [Hymenobacter segetis]|uniref:Uncharacterized protein n=1 Tax=Hymenobacter segetis TaxID=2025509 RepID=A0ABU9LY75_9BACT